MKINFLAALWSATASIVVFVAQPAAALDFALTFDSSFDQYPQARAGVEQAAAMWRSVLSSPVTVSLNLHIAPIDYFVVGFCESQSQEIAYSDVRAALVARATSEDDTTAVVHLPAGPNLEFLGMIPQGYRVFNRGDQYINQYLDVPRANARALGLPVPVDGQADADISISRGFLQRNEYDFQRADGIQGIDFLAVLSHEIGHALGFTSGVDYVDYNTLPSGPEAPFDLSDYSVASPLDLFRYTALSKPLIDLAAGGEPYFSINGGQTNLAPFSSGGYNGNGWEASHWVQGTGIMDPYFVDDEPKLLSAVDRQAFDVIGWDLRVAMPGDFDRDSSITGADVQAMLGALADLDAYKLAMGLIEADLGTIGDLNADGAISNADLQALLDRLINGGGVLAAVPEPASIVSLAGVLPMLACVVLGRIARRNPTSTPTNNNHFSLNP